MKVLTFDPGGHTGWSYWEEGQLAECGCAIELKDVMRVISNHALSTVVCEDFVGQAFTEDEKLTIKRIGAIEAMCILYNCELVMQAPAVRKGYLQFAKTHAMLQLVDADVRRHAKDAIAHGIRYHCKEVEGWQKQYLTY